MKYPFIIFCTVSVLLFPILPALDVSPAKVRMLYHSLDPQSIARHLALYELYPDYAEGKQALKEAVRLLAGTDSSDLTQLPALDIPIRSLIALVNKQPNQEVPLLSESDYAIIERVAKRLPNRKLKGRNVWSEAEVLELSGREIDLARGLFLSQMGNDETAKRKIQSYEAILDLMALQILAKLPSKTGPVQKIRAINDFIFYDMGFRFPPHSVYAKDIDLYTFLPSVIDSRKGVCLGVSVLYMCLAQRLDLQTEMITPPGHIYVRFKKGKTEINIETTARGVHLDSEEYLGIDTRSLQRRTIKEVIGLTHFNQASVFWQQENPEQALVSYKKAYPYIPDDMLLKELMGYNYLFAGNVELGRQLLEEVKDHLPEYAVTKQTISEDYLNGEVDEKGIQSIFTKTDETRASLLKKRDILIDALNKYPRFRAGIFSLAGIWLQLHRHGEALEALERYHALDPGDPSVEYYLAALYTERMDTSKAWEHLHVAEAIVKTRNHDPKALKELRQELCRQCP